ncbi:uncharacterized protein LOC143470761 [Clavelina lepadiformis]|uniref:uncharacterized protein LOC143470761 n=1 Tax=Clavelina lepadiformis TaxID=159417 RepID=UPI004042A3A0
MNKYYHEAVDAVAEFVGADKEDIFVIDNATTGINSIMKSLKFKAGTKVLMTNHTYLAVKNTIKDIEEMNGGFQRIFMDIPVPIKSEGDIIDLYEKYFSTNADIKIAVIDHITSPSAIVLPVERLIGLCRKYNILSVIDGAHAPGQVKLNLNEMQPDFYVGNLHKWVYTARSTGFLWVSPAFRGTIYPPISSNYVQTMHHRFAYMGTRDYSAFYTIPVALKFFKDIGGLEALTSYTSGLLSWAVRLLCEALNTKPLDIPSTMKSPVMAIMSLPPLPDGVRDLTADQLTVDFWLKYAVQTCFTSFNDRLWLRISANIYNCRSDYLKLRDCLLHFFEMNPKD